MPKLGPPARHHVERGDRLGEQRGVPVGVAGDQRGQPDSLRVLGQRRQQRVALDHVLIGRAEPGELVEVVHREHGVEAGFLGLDRLLPDGGEQPLRGDAGVGEVRDLVAETRHESNLRGPRTR